MTEISLEVQRARTVEEVIRTAALGLEGLGLVVAFSELTGADDERTARWVSEPLKALATSLIGARLKSRTSGRLGEALRTERALFVPNLVELTQAAFDASRHAEIGAVLTSLTMRAAVITPVMVRGTAWASLVLAGGGLREDDLPALTLLGLHVGAAIEVAQGLARLDQRTAELEVVQVLAEAGPHADADALCAQFLKTVSETTKADSAVFHRLDPATNELVMVGEINGAARATKRWARFPVTEQTEALMRARIIAVKNVPNSPELVELGLSWLAMVRLAIDGKLVGLLSLARREDVRFSEADVRSAEILGLQMSSVLERARLYDEVSGLYTDLKRSYDELGRAQAEVVRHERLAALGELAAVMAHEVRNPLGVIFNSVNALRRLVPPTGDAPLLLSIVGEEADRLNRIVGDLLDFVRPYEVATKPIDVGPIISSAIEAAKVAVPSSIGDVRVLEELPSAMPPFPVDGHLLKQGLVNLLVNALQAMPRGGTVRVRASTEDRRGQHWMRIEVSDEGDGLPARVVERMFQPFFTTKVTGTGLGLAVVKRIVDAHGGEVTAEPNSEGKGTTFVVRFPSVGRPLAAG